MKRDKTILGWLTLGSAASLVALVTGCTPPKTAPPPPPPAQVLIPPQPRPPLGAPDGMRIPPINAAGMRQTINLGVGPDQLLWNFRSAYNVAALNCMNAEHGAILENYKSFLKTYAKALVAANKGVDQQFAVSKSKANVRARESYMTQVYNYYALPPTLPAFCDAALAMSIDLQALPVTPANEPARKRGKAAAKAVPEGSATALRDFAAANLPKLDRVFLDFYTSYDQYRTDLAAWQQRYAPSAPPTINPAAAPIPASGSMVSPAPAGPPAATPPNR